MAGRMQRGFCHGLQALTAGIAAPARLRASYQPQLRSAFCSSSQAASGAK